jgi:PUA domain
MLYQVRRDVNYAYLWGCDPQSRAYGSITLLLEPLELPHPIDFPRQDAGKVNGFQYGTAKAIVQQGKSLLPAGITQVTGEFIETEVVQLCNAHGQEVARS